MIDCPYTWRIFFAGAAAGVASVVLSTCIVGFMVWRRQKPTVEGI